MLPSVDHRVDAHYVRFLAGLYTEPEREIATGQASIYGFCEKPDTDSEVGPPFWPDGLNNMGGADSLHGSGALDR